MYVPDLFFNIVSIITSGVFLIFFLVQYLSYKSSSHYLYIYEKKKKTIIINNYTFLSLVHKFRVIINKWKLETMPRAVLAIINFWLMKIKCAVKKSPFTGWISDIFFFLLDGSKTNCDLFLLVIGLRWVWKLIKIKDKGVHIKSRYCFYVLFVYQQRRCWKRLNFTQYYEVGLLAEAYGCGIGKNSRK